MKHVEESLLETFTHKQHLPLIMKKLQRTAANGTAVRLVATERYHTSGYECHEFYKPISKIIRHVRS